MKFSKLIILVAALMSIGAFAQDSGRGDGPGNNTVNKECSVSLGEVRAVKKTPGNYTGTVIHGTVAPSRDSLYKKIYEDLFLKTLKENNLELDAKAEHVLDIEVIEGFYGMSTDAFHGPFGFVDDGTYTMKITNKNTGESFISKKGNDSNMFKTNWYKRSVRANKQVIKKLSKSLGCL